MCQDLGKHMICVCEIRGEERREGSEPLVHGLAHMSDDDIVAFGQGRICSMHEHVLKRFLHARGTLRSGLADEPRDRRVLQSSLLHVQLEVFEVFVGGLGKHLHVLSKGLSNFSPECFRTL